VSPVRYEVGFNISEDAILHSLIFLGHSNVDASPLFMFVAQSTAR
jgi:hypothetical protein